MSDFRTAVLETYHRYPVSTMQDIIKFTCQSTFGPAHLLRDTASAVRYVLSEEAGVTDKPSLTLEPLSGGYCRAHLGGELTGRMIACLFLLSAFTAPSPDDTSAVLSERCAVLHDLCRNSELPESWEKDLDAWEASGCPTVHHSEGFRNAYAPAYRVISEDSLRFLPFLRELEIRFRKRDASSPFLIAVDGGSASGKSTFGAALAAAYDANLFHMDDFFLRPEQRTPARFAEPGGNVDYERFHAEVLTPLLSGKAFSYRVFDCRTMALGDTVGVLPKPAAVVEGAYSLHPDFGSPYAISLLMRCAPDVQMARILRRNGEKLARRFRDEWIPMENAYFLACDTENTADFVIK